MIIADEIWSPENLNEGIGKTLCCQMEQTSL